MSWSPLSVMFIVVVHSCLLLDGAIADDRSTSSSATRKEIAAARTGKHFAVYFPFKEHAPGSSDGSRVPGLTSECHIHHGGIAYLDSGEAYLSSLSVHSEIANQWYTVLNLKQDAIIPIGNCIARVSRIAHRVTVNGFHGRVTLTLVEFELLDSELLPQQIRRKTAKSVIIPFVVEDGAFSARIDKVAVGFGKYNVSQNLATISCRERVRGIPSDEFRLRCSMGDIVKLGRRVFRVVSIVENDEIGWIELQRVMRNPNNAAEPAIL